MICDVLEGDGRVTEAIECFKQMYRELGGDTSIHNERVQWELSECYREQHDQHCLSMGHRFSTAMHRQVGEARRRRDGFSEVQ